MNWVLVALISPVILPALRLSLILVTKRRSDASKIAMIFYGLASLTAAALIGLMKSNIEGFYGSMLLVPVWLLFFAIAIYSDVRSYFSK